jgi:PAS domain S-box-containing protein
MAKNVSSDCIAPRSFISIELSDHCKDAPELYLLAMLDASASCVAVLDEAGTILYVNRAWRQLAVRHNLAREQYGVRLNYLEICKRVSGASPDVASAITEGIAQILLGRELEFQQEYSCPESNPQSRGLIRAARFDLPNAFRVLVTHDDLTAQQQASEAQKNDEERLRLLLKMTSILPWESDVESGRFTYVGEQAAQLLGYPTEQWYETGFWSSHLHPDDRERAFTDCLKYSQALDNYDFEYRMIASDGRVVWLHDLVSVIHQDGEPKTIRGFLIDITERKLAEETLVNLSGLLINAQEEERKRIARELHDDLNQKMALLSIELAQLGRKIQKPRHLSPLVQGLQTKAQEISTEIHRLSYRLHPSKLDHLGLAAAIQSLCQDLSASGTLKIGFQQKGFSMTVSKDVRLCVYRIAQEALRNCLRHSGAHKAQVVLEEMGGAIRLSVTDDGCGFDMKSGVMKKGLGFTSMRERLRLVGGEMQVSSQPESGTRIEVSVPLTMECELNPMRFRATNM